MKIGRLTDIGLSRRHFLKGTSLNLGAMAAISGVPLFEHLGTKIVEEPKRFRDLPNPFLLTELRVVFDPDAETLGSAAGVRMLQVTAGKRIVVPSVTRYSHEPVWAWRPGWGQWIDLSGEKRIRVTTNSQPVETLIIGVGTHAGIPVIIEPEVDVRVMRLEQ